MAVFMKYEGIPGNATADGYKDHIRIASVQFGVGRGITMEAGNLANRESTKPSISEITCTTEVDKCIVPLFKEAVSGAKGKKVEISMVQTGSAKLVEYMKIETEDTLVSGWSFTADGDNKGWLTFSLSFAKITQTYNDHDKGNAGGSPLRSGFDLITAKPM
jgi:type VI secretion system secreted protein Hcp